ncbi:MAG: hypothetical protein CL566_09810 [Alphaproteobacteria bacterium]|nr:hypothetical protein [Alphaproteobacteria bacterium]
MFRGHFWPYCNVELYALRDIVPTFNESGANGDDSWTLLMPDPIFVDSSGTFRAANIELNYASWPKLEKTLADVQAL